MDPDDVLSREGTVASGGRFAAVGVRAVYLSTTDTGASKETTARKSRLGGSALISTAKYPRVVFAVTTKLQRVLRLEDLGSSGPGGDVKKAVSRGRFDCIRPCRHADRKGWYPRNNLSECCEGGDDNLIVYLANCDHGALQTQNEHEFIEQAKKMVSKRKL